MTPVLLFGLSAVLSPAHAGWSVTKNAGDCSYLQGSAGADGTTPVRVECEWADVDAAALHGILARPESHAAAFSGLSEARVVRRSGPIAQVYQRFAARGVSDREVVVEYSAEDVPSGRRYQWRKSADQSTLRGDAVEVPTTEGKWEVTEADGKVRLVYELRLKLGGLVPSFMVRWAQGGAVEQTIEELRSKVSR